MEDSGIQGKYDIDAMLSESTLHNYVNISCNDEYHPPLINGKMPPSKNSPVSKLTSTSITSRYMNYVHDKIQCIRISNVKMCLKLQQYMLFMQLV